MSSSIKTLARHTAVYGIGDLVGRAVAVVLLPVYARYFTEGENGLVGLGFALLGFCTVLYTLGMNQALIRALANWDTDDDDLRTRRFSTAVLFLALVAVVASGTLWLLARETAVAFLGGEQNAVIVRMLALILLLDTLSEPFFTLCRSRQRSVRFAVTRLVQHGTQIGLVLYAILVRDRGVVAVFEANVVSSVFALVAIAPTGLRWLRPRFSVEDLRPLLAFGLPFVPSAVAMLVINLADRFLVEHYLGLEQLGVYVVAYKVGIPMLLVVRAFRSAWAPGVLAVSQPEEAHRLCARVTTYYAAAATAFLLGVYAYSRDLIVLVAGDNAESFLPGHEVAPLVTLGYLIYGLYVILTAGVYAEGRAGILPATIGAGAAVNIGLNVLLIPVMGYIAAAWSTVAANTVMVGLLFIATRKFYPVAFEYARLGKLVVAAAIVGASLSGYRADLTVSGVVARAIFLLAYPIILWGWRFIEPSEWTEIRNIFRPSGDPTPEHGSHV